LKNKQDYFNGIDWIDSFEFKEQDWNFKEAGAEAELHMFSKGGHGYGMNKINAPVDRWSQLLIDWILAL